MNSSTIITQGDLDRAFKTPFLDLLLKIMRNTYGLRSVELMPPKVSPLYLEFKGIPRTYFIEIDSVMCPTVINEAAWDLPKIKIIKSYFENYSKSKDGVVVVDVGAHQGLFSRQIIAVIKNVTMLYAFEPSPRNFELLSRNIGFLENLTLLNVGLGDTDAEMSLYEDQENHGNYSLNPFVMPDALTNPEKIAFKVKVMHPGNYESNILSHKRPIIYKSDTQSLDLLIASNLSLEFWNKVEVAIIELWRVPHAPIINRSLLRKIFDLFQYKYMHDNLSHNFTTDNIFEYLNVIDFNGTDLILLKEPVNID